MRVALLLLVVAAAASGQTSGRRLTVDIRLTRGDAPLWRQALPGDKADGVLASWGLRFEDVMGRVIDLPPSTTCDHDPFCRAWSPSGGACLDLFAAGHEEWDERYSCYADSRTLFLGEEFGLLDVTIPDGAVQASLTFYARDDALRRKLWPPEDRSRLMLVLRPAADFRLAVAVELVAGPDGRPREVRLDYCLPSGGDAEARRKRLLSGEDPTCRLLPTD